MSEPTGSTQSEIDTQLALLANACTATNNLELYFLRRKRPRLTSWKGSLPPHCVCVCVCPLKQSLLLPVRGRPTGPPASHLARRLFLFPCSDHVCPPSPEEVCPRCSLDFPQLAGGARRADRSHGRRPRWPQALMFFASSQVTDEHFVGAAAPC